MVNFFFCLIYIKNKQQIEKEKNKPLLWKIGVKKQNTYSLNIYFPISSHTHTHIEKERQERYKKEEDHTYIK